MDGGVGENFVGGWGRGGLTPFPAAAEALTTVRAARGSINPVLISSSELLLSRELQQQQAGPRCTHKVEVSPVDGWGVNAVFARAATLCVEHTLIKWLWRWHRNTQRQKHPSSSDHHAPSMKQNKNKTHRTHRKRCGKSTTSTSTSTAARLHVAVEKQKKRWKRKSLGPTNTVKERGGGGGRELAGMGAQQASTTQRLKAHKKTTYRQGCRNIKQAPPPSTKKAP